MTSGFFPIVWNFEFSLSKGSRSEVFCKIGVLRNFAKFTRKHLCQSLLFNKVAGLLRWLLLFKQGLYFLLSESLAVNCLNSQWHLSLVITSSKFSIFDRHFGIILVTPFSILLRRFLWHLSVYPFNFLC